MKFFYRVNKKGNPIPGTLAKLSKIPDTGFWKKVPKNCCPEDCIPAINWSFTVLNAETIGDFIITINGIPVVNLLNQTAGVFNGTVYPKVGDTVEISVTNEVNPLTTNFIILGQVDVIQTMPTGQIIIWDGTRMTNVYASITGGEGGGGGG